MLHQTAFLLPKTLALLTTATLDTDFLRWHHVTGSRVTVSTGSVKCPIASVRTIFQRFLVAYRSVMLRTVLTNRELETWLQWRRYSLYTPVNRTISWHPHHIYLLTSPKYNHSINEQKYNMISNGWLKKGKIPVKYSQPIHRKYVYKINQHSINQHSKTE